MGQPWHIDRFQKAEEKTGIGFQWIIDQWIIDKYLKIINSFEKSPLAQDAKVVIAALAEVSKMKGFYAPEKKVSLTIDATKKCLKEARGLFVFKIEC